MPPLAAAVHRIEVSPRPGLADPIADSLLRDAAAIGLPLSAARTSHVYLIQAPLTPSHLDTIRTRLLADPVTEVSTIGATPAPAATQTIEIHPLPGVMDPVAQTVQEAIRDLTGIDAQVSTGWRYDLAATRADADRLATRFLANPVIQRIHHEPYHPTAFPTGRSHEHAVRHIPLRNLTPEQLTKLSRDAHLFLSLDEMQAIQKHYAQQGRDPTEIELETLAQTWSEHCVHKTLKSTITYRSHEGTKAQSHEGAGSSDPSSLRGSVAPWLFSKPRPGHTINPDGSVTIHNLLKSTVAAATHELIAEGLDWTLSVFVDNAGVIAFDDQHAVCIKVETHNHPSAIEPYGGAATGAGGCIRDVIGTGLAARPIANTDVFCVAHPTHWREASDTVAECSPAPNLPGSQLPFGNLPFAISPLPPNTLHPRRILSQVVAGVRDYGNRMGIPTVSGAVAFDDRYVGNPLVFCGCIGVMPSNRIRGKVQPGDLIVALGGRTGRDGIHGATFSSTELEHTSADEFAHAVQIGNAIEEKRVLDAIMRARDHEAGPLFNGLTDCGAGGFSSAVGEMAKDTGAIVHLDRAPLKYAGLSATEIWISEAQERMVLAVPPSNLDALKRICSEESVELAVLGEFTPPPSGRGRGEGSSSDGPDLQLLFHNQEVGRLSMHFLHDGIPTPHRDATWPPPSSSPTSDFRVPTSDFHSIPQSEIRTPHSPPPTSDFRDPTSHLLAILSHPNVASKHWIIRQYDHEVRGNTLIKPLVGPESRGPSDASVVQPVPCSSRGLAISQGLQTGIGDPALPGGGGDPYLMALAAIDECVRNLVCVGADPSRIAILDNFCWPSCGKPHHLGALVRAAEGCYDAAKAYRTPFVSGKDSLNNQLTYTDPATGAQRTIEIPYTLLITGIGILPDIARCTTMDAKRPGNILLLVGPGPQPQLGGSIYQQLFRSGRALSGAGVPPASSDKQELPSISLEVPATNLTLGPQVARAVASLIAQGLVASAHDVSDGGTLTAVAEILIAGSADAAPIGAHLDLADDSTLFAETPSNYILELDPANLAEAQRALDQVPHQVIGRLNSSGTLTLAAHSLPVSALRDAWLHPLDW